MLVTDSSRAAETLTLHCTAQLEVLMYPKDVGGEYLWLYGLSTGEF